MLVNAVQPLNALVLIIFSPFPITTLCKPLQLVNADVPNVITLSGIFNVVIHETIKSSTC